MLRCKSVMSALLIMFLIATVAKACSDPPPSTTLRFVIISIAPGPPVVIRIRLIFDPWTTFASAQGQFCSCAFRFPTAIIDTVDAVRMVETGTDNLVPGFETWMPNSTTSAAVENMLGAGAGNEWFGFLNGLGSAVAPGIEADFQVDVTLNPGIDEGDLIDALRADMSNLVYSDESNSSGEPTGNHGGFVDANVTSIPTVSHWGLVVLTLVGLAMGTIYFGRRRAVRS